MTEEELRQNKEIQGVSAAMNAFVNTSMEYDKSILSLSAAGIGMMVTLLTAKGVSSLTPLCFYLLAIVFFTAALATILKVFRINKEIVNSLFLPIATVDITQPATDIPATPSGCATCGAPAAPTGKGILLGIKRVWSQKVGPRGSLTAEQKGALASKWALRFFFMGVLASFGVGLLSARDMYTKEMEMAQYRDNDGNLIELNPDDFMKSLDGMSGMFGRAIGPNVTTGLPVFHGATPTPTVVNPASESSTTPAAAVESTTPTVPATSSSEAAHPTVPSK